jgi:hypothetical protein
MKRQTVQANPKQKQHIAGTLYDTLRHSNLISWDSKGRVSIKGAEIPGSSITDLISDVVRDRKSTNPEGWSPFSDILAELNVPQEYIANTRRREFIMQKQRLQSTPSSATKKAPYFREKSQKVLGKVPRNTGKISYQHNE